LRADLLAQPGKAIHGIEIPGTFMPQTATKVREPIQEFDDTKFSLTSHLQRIIAKRQDPHYPELIIIRKTLRPFQN
jgi:hypothetical protein